MAVLGFFYAWLTSSEAILLDGIFSLVNFAMVILTLKVSQKAIQPPTYNFQFGLGQLEPMLNSFKGFILLGVVIMAMLSAINSLIHDGRSMLFGPAIYYASIATIGCFLIAFIIRHYAKQTSSSLLVVETKGWFIDAALSCAVLITFIIGHYLADGKYSWFIAFLDPAMVLFMCIIILPTPLKIINSNLKNLLLKSPDRAVQKRLDFLLHKILTQYKITEYQPRYIGSSRSIYLHLFIKVSNLDIDTLDTIRNSYLNAASKENISVELVIEVSKKDL